MNSRFHIQNEVALEDQAFPVEIDTFLEHRFLQVMDVHDPEAVRFNGDLQRGGCLRHTLFGG